MDFNLLVTKTFGTSSSSEFNNLHGHVIGDTLTSNSLPTPTWQVGCCPLALVVEVSVKCVCPPLRMVTDHIINYLGLSSVFPIS